METLSIKRIAENSVSMSLDHNPHKTFYESVRNISTPGFEKPIPASMRRYQRRTCGR